MKVCIPITDDAGLEARLSPHFGRAPYFALVDLDCLEVHVAPNAQARHAHGECGLPTLAGVGAVICRGIGRNALLRLRHAGVEVYVTEVETVAESVREFAAGQLVQLPESAACSGGHHDH